MTTIKTLFAAGGTSRHRRLATLFLLVGAFCAPQAGAAGFGEIVLHSRIGENLLAEVPVFGSGKDLTDPDCYALASQPNADLPVITKARIRIVKHKDAVRLVIATSRPVSDPAFMLSLRANCGNDMRKDFVLMPDAPIQSAEAGSASASPTARPSEADLTEDAPAKKSKRTKSSRRDTPPSLGLSSDQARPPRTTAPGNGDRLVLSTAPLDMPAGDAVAAPATAADIEDRLLRMETKLHSLSEQIDTLDTSLKLSTEMMTAQHDLKVAQELRQTPGAGVAPPPETERTASAGGWFELLLSSLVGGSLVVGLAAYLGRHKQANRPVI